MPRIEGAIDSVSMQSLCRPPALKIRKPGASDATIGLRLLEKAIEEGLLRVHLDSGGGIEGEWATTCGVDIIQTVLIKWIDLEGVVRTPAAVMPKELKVKLKAANFNDTGDKLLVRLAIGARETHQIDAFHIGTTDPDFWDPSDNSKRGKANAPVASALVENGIWPTVFREFVKLITN